MLHRSAALQGLGSDLLKPSFKIISSLIWLVLPSIKHTIIITNLSFQT